jgi:hypothetical protein
LLRRAVKTKWGQFTGKNYPHKTGAAYRRFYFPADTLVYPGGFAGQLPAYFYSASTPMIDAIKALMPQQKKSAELRLLGCVVLRNRREPNCHK